MTVDEAKARLRAWGDEPLLGPGHGIVVASLGVMVAGVVLRGLLRAALGRRMLVSLLLDPRVIAAALPARLAVIGSSGGSRS